MGGLRRVDDDHHRRAGGDRGPDRDHPRELLHAHGPADRRLRHQDLGVDHADLGHRGRARRLLAARSARLGALVHDRGGQPELHRPARLRRVAPVSALGAGHDGDQHPRALRPHRALERRQGGAPVAVESGSMSDPSAPERPAVTTAPAATDGAGIPEYAREAADVVADLGSDATAGLTRAEAEARLARDGPNEIAGEKPPSVREIVLAQLREPMNIMLVAVTVVSFAIGEVSTGVLVALLILLNLVLGTRQELTARASIDALSNLQVPQAKVVRDGTLALVPASGVVVGDIVQLEAGDIVPADG